MLLPVAPTLLFRPYAKMPAAGENRAQPSPGGPWIALEKIHGAQLVVAVHGGAVHFGKRKAWLSEDEPFFGWQLLRARLRACALHMVQSLRAEQSRVYFYGELFGGHYPHPEVPSVPGLFAVQTGIWYSPALHWAPFDVLIARSDEDEGVLIAHRDLEAAAQEAGLSTPPVLRRGTRAEVAAVPTRRPSLVPAMLGLPSLEVNIAEGVVIKSELPAPPSARASSKRKIEEFNEGRFDESAAWNPNQPLSVDALGSWAQRLINPARIASALSKWGRGPLEPLLEEVILDVRVDLELAFPAACRALSPVEEEQLSARIREGALPLLRAALA
ncbi:RNA ligase family protein [Citreicoccus inhibens]|uniref:RNA ligase family protein n=1 Tax=Citreicoccus inhibens TaxID=2849499 RepID=UPI001F1FB845|nr:RNA ligase family protein [Citreicoccus inhibens]